MARTAVRRLARTATRLALAPCALAVLAAALPATAVEAAENLEAYLRREMDLRGIPGLGYAVVEGGAVLQSGSLGLANVELRVPVVAESVFPIASLDKGLTASGVMRLVETGKLTLDADASQLLALPWPGIRVADLLAHTSGLPDEVAALVNGRELVGYSTAEHFEHVRGLTPLAPPGVRYHYSDANLFLAQLLIEKVSGEGWRDFMRREIYLPAGMRDVVHFDPEAVFANRVPGYRLGPQRELRRDGRIEVDYGPLYNDVGMTVGDFARWLISLGAGSPLAAATLDRMWTPTRLADGGFSNETWQWSNYGLGFGLDMWAGRRVITHSGSSGVGYIYLPDTRSGVVVFTNLRHHSGSDPVGLAQGIAGFYWPELALVDRPVTAGDAADGRRTAVARRLYESLLAGRPDLDAVAVREHTSVWEGTGELADRSAGWGPLLSFDDLGNDRAGDHVVRLFRARHERGRIVVRVEFDAAGAVRRLVWSHP